MEFKLDSTFDVWRDRATFHFLMTQDQVTRYLTAARQFVGQGGYAVIGTFSMNGPEKCSGLPIRQYIEGDLRNMLSDGFDKIRCISEDHITPFNTFQNFLFGSFKRN